MYPILSILIAVFLGMIGQLLVKIGLNSLGGIDFSKGLIAGYIRVFLSVKVLSGTLSYTVSIFFWLYALSKVDLSFAYPFLALSYVFILLASWLILGENIPILRWVGVIVICLGVFLVART